MSKTNKKTRDVWCDHCDYRFTTQVSGDEASVGCPNCGKATLLVHCATCGNDAELAQVNFEKGNWVCPTCKEYRDFSAETLTDFLSAQIGIEELAQPRRRRGRPTFRSGCITLIILYFLANIALSSCGDVLARRDRLVAEDITRVAENLIRPTQRPTRPRPTVTPVATTFPTWDFSDDSAELLGQYGQLAYVSDAIGGGRDVIHLHDVESGSTRWVERPLSGSRITNLQWQADGLGFHYATTRLTPASSYLITSDLSGNVQQTVEWSGTSNEFRHSLLSPSGDQIAFVKTSIGGSDKGLFLQEVASAEASESPAQKSATQLVDLNISALAWSPDGSQIAFLAKGSNTHLYLHHIEQNQTTRLTDTNALRENLAWSPNGAILVYTGNHKLYLYDVLKGEETILLNLYHVVTAQTPTWTPDGKYVVFSADIDKDFDLYAYEPATSRLIRILDTPENELYPVWQPPS